MRGVFAAREHVRVGVATLLVELRQRGIRPLILTGDQRGKAEALSGELGGAEIRAGLLPDDKLEVVRQLRGARRCRYQRRRQPDRERRHWRRNPERGLAAQSLIVK